MTRFWSRHVGLRLPGEILVNLTDLALSKKVTFSKYVIGVLEDHCKNAPRPRVDAADREGRPSAGQYSEYCRRLELLFKAIDGRIEAVAVKRGRTQFDNWAASISGESDRTRRTVRQWEKIFTKAGSYGDIFHEKSESTTPNDRLAQAIKAASDLYEFGKDD